MSARPANPLRVDWTSCQGRGLCHEIAPELVELDPWGYPLLREAGTTAEADRLAREAVATCPLQALTVRPGQS